MANDSRKTPPFRAEHVGSLLRPKHVAEVREKWRGGSATEADFNKAADEAIREAVALQESVGIKGVTDGEMRRDYWHLDFMDGFDGVDLVEQFYGMKFSGGLQVRTTHVGAKIKYPEKGIMRDHFKFLKSATKETAKFTMPSPSMFHFRPGRDGISSDAYPDLDEFWADVGKAYNDAMLDLASMGCTYLQIDDVNYCYLCDAEQRERVKERGDDPDKLLDTYIEANNAALEGRPANMFTATHMCRGNFQSEWMAQGGYEPVADAMFNKSNFDAFYMEFDSDRAGGFEPLRFVPKGKYVVLGLVTSKHPELEPKSDLKKRIEEATKYVDLDYLCLSPQCGFASTHHGNKMTMDDQRRKLALCVEVADEVWGS